MKISVNSRNCRLSKETTEASREQVQAILSGAVRLRSARITFSKEGQSYLAELHLTGPGIDARSSGFGYEPETAIAAAIDSAEGQLERAIARQKSRHARQGSGLDDDDY